MSKTLVIDKDWLSYFDVTFSDVNIKEALADRAKAIEDEYEAFNRMYVADGLVNKCPRKL